MDLLDDSRKVKTRVDALKKIFLKERRQYKRKTFHPKSSLSVLENENRKAALALENEEKRRLWDEIRTNLMTGNEREEERMNSDRTETEAEIAEKNRRNGRRRREVRQMRFGTKVAHASSEKNFRRYVEFSLRKCLAVMCEKTEEEMDQEFQEYSKKQQSEEEKEVKKACERVRDEMKDNEEEGGDTNTQGEVEIEEEGKEGNEEETEEEIGEGDGGEEEMEKEGEEEEIGEGEEEIGEEEGKAEEEIEVRDLTKKKKEELKTLSGENSFERRWPHVPRLHHKIERTPQHFEKKSRNSEGKPQTSLKMLKKVIWKRKNLKHPKGKRAKSQTRKIQNHPKSQRKTPVPTQKNSQKYRQQGPPQLPP